MLPMWSCKKKSSNKTPKELNSYMMILWNSMSRGFERRASMIRLNRVFRLAKMKKQQVLLLRRKNQSQRRLQKSPGRHQ